MQSPKLDKKREANDFGHQAEQIATDYLLGLGYTVRERNWSIAGRFEIDIIAQDGDNMVFVEVKARKGDCQDPLDAIDTRKMRQMVKAADAYLGHLEHRFYYRFDVITVTGTQLDYILEHHPNAFLSPLSVVKK